MLVCHIEIIGHRMSDGIVSLKFAIINSDDELSGQHTVLILADLVEVEILGISSPNRNLQ